MTWEHVLYLLKDDRIKYREHKCLYDRGIRKLYYEPICEEKDCPVKECPFRR